MLKFALFCSSLLITLLSLAACGGGGGSSSPSTASANTTALVTIGLNGTLPGNSALAGVSFTLYLPPNVTPATTDGAVATGVVTPSGTFAGGVQIPPVYTPATQGTVGKMQIALANTNETGVTQVGEVATITLLLANGETPAASNFVLRTDGVIDLAGNPVTTVNAFVAGVTLH